MITFLEREAFYMSLHIAAKEGEIAEVVLLPGDPLRAKHIAETFLENPQQYTSIRNIYGFTGTYKGKRVSVQATGMGVPSISIYTHELITQYGVKKLIRVGTCGGMHEDVKLRDIVIAQAATTDSGIIRQIFGNINFAPIADYELLSKAVLSAKTQNIPVRVGNVVTGDRFYDEEIDNAKLVKYGALAVEMETAGLYVKAAEFGVKALALFTVSDHLVRDEHVPPEERQTTFNDMIKVALEAAIMD